ncbi:hypothetical protein SD3246_3406 [Salmonella enterica subsp. enterica serovar Dublin str. SD3246]|uniref:Uncharacterized protein n=1 Tax=Salmonella enterica subsp. enterica serovar Dublin str. SD3246 TaxID=909945 RepID=A0A8X6EVC8_SALDU|nr:hypothetical protein SD3246_3406 [Salmonella enterica subsp. enterica serovar Dublin str. SD3246]
MFFRDHYGKPIGIRKNRQKSQVMLIFPNFMTRCFTFNYLTENAGHSISPLTEGLIDELSV